MKEKLKERWPWGPQSSCSCSCFLLSEQIYCNLTRRPFLALVLPCRWWSLSAACMVPLGATPRKRKFTLSTATPHCLPPTFTARQWFTGVLRRRRWLSLGALWRNLPLPREEAPGTNHNGKRASWPRDSALRLRAGPTQHLSRTEGVILDPGEAGGDRSCFTRTSELF